MMLVITLERPGSVHRHAYWQGQSRQSGSSATRSADLVTFRDGRSAQSALPSIADLRVGNGPLTAGLARSR
jgi:hypothetical protein